MATSPSSTLGTWLLLAGYSSLVPALITSGSLGWRELPVPSDVPCGILALPHRMPSTCPHTTRAAMAVVAAAGCCARARLDGAAWCTLGCVDTRPVAHPPRAKRDSAGAVMAWLRSKQPKARRCWLHASVAGFMTWWASLGEFAQLGACALCSLCGRLVLVTLTYDKTRSTWLMLCMTPSDGATLQNSEYAPKVSMASM